MRYLLSSALMTLLVGATMAAGEPRRNSAIPTHNPSDLTERRTGANPVYDGREGGEDIASAFAIPGDVSLLPFHDTGATCDNVNDYDETCGDVGSSSPDVVYSFTPSQDVHVDVDLSASYYYDTKVYVYDSSQTVIACNDDAYYDLSYIYDVALTGGETYYIVIDGSGGDCGSYDLVLYRRDGCAIECPAGAIAEGEPPCGDGYVDEYNGGCYSPDPIWSVIEGDATGCATICGKSCTHVSNGLSYRDIDWYEATAAGGPVTFSGEAVFPLLLILDPYTNCAVSPEGPYTETPLCTPAEVSYACSPGQRVWLWVSPSIFQGVPESNYVFTVCGLVPQATPADRTSWGQIKARFREPTR